MIIIAGHSHWKTVVERDAAVAAFAAMIGQARQQDGCIDMAITADSLDPTRSNLFECWRDDQAWKGWQKVAKGPKVRALKRHVSLYRSDAAQTL